MKQSAGILPYRFSKNSLEIFLVHPGGPLWKNKDEGSWSIAKGEFNNNENALTAACREFAEETGITCKGPFIELQTVKQRSGKMIYSWATKVDIDVSTIKSNEFEIQWPPGSGQLKSYPEIDRACWFAPGVAKQKIIPSQAAIIDDLMAKLNLTE